MKQERNETAFCEIRYCGNYEDCFAVSSLLFYPEDRGSRIRRNLGVYQATRNHNLYDSNFKDNLDVLSTFNSTKISVEFRKVITYMAFHIFPATQCYVACGDTLNEKRSFDPFPVKDEI